MPKEPLFPHIPKKKEPLFPHQPKGKQEKRTWYLGECWEEEYSTAEAVVYRSADGKKRLYAYSDGRKEVSGAPEEKLPQTREAEYLKHFWVEKNIPYESWAIIEAFPGGVVRSPFSTKEEAIEREQSIGRYWGWNLKLVPSPQEKYPKQNETLKKLYPYEFIEYHDDGDLTLQLLVPKLREKRGFKPGNKVVVTTDGEVFAHYTADEALKKILGSEYLPETINLLAKVEGDPRGFVKKFCCRQCGECAPPELLEEGMFLDRISWLRHHYKEKHPGMWGRR